MTLNTVWGGYDVQAIHKHPIRLILISRSSLVMAKKCPIGGVWKVSGGWFSSQDNRGLWMVFVCHSVRLRQSDFFIEI